MATEFFTDDFGGLGPIQPREFSLVLYPTQATDIIITSDNERSHHVSMTTTGLKFKLPETTGLGIGASFIIANTGANAFDITKSDDTVVQVAATGINYFVELTDGSTTAGTWRSTAWGATVNESTAADLQGNGLVDNLGKLDVNVDGTSIVITTDALEVATNGIGATEIDSNTYLATIDGFGIEAFSGTLRVAAAIAGVGLTGGSGVALTHDFASLTTVVPAGDDEIMISDTSDSGALKTITAGSLSTNTQTFMINGDMNIWQRGTSFAAIATDTYFADRLVYDKVGAMIHTVSRSTDTPTQLQSSHLSNYSALIDCTTIDATLAVGDFCHIGTILEGYDILPLVGNDFVLSFWVKGTKTGTHCVAFRNGATADRSYVVEYAINLTDTWEKKEIPITGGLIAAGTWNYTNGAGLEISWCLASGTTFHTTADAWQTGNFFATANQVNACDNISNNFRIAQVRLELGTAASTFTSRPIKEELELCQRYYAKSYNQGVDPGTVTDAGAVNGLSVGVGANSIGANIQYPTELRALATTLTTYNPATASTTGSWERSDAVNISSATRYSGTRGFNIINSAASTDASEHKIHWTAEAEL